MNSNKRVFNPQLEIINKCNKLHQISSIIKNIDTTKNIGTNKLSYYIDKDSMMETIIININGIHNYHYLRMTLCLIL